MKRFPRLVAVLFGSLVWWEHDRYYKHESQA